MKAWISWLGALAFVVATPVGASAVLPVSYAPPAGNLPAGHLHGLTYSAVLPSGRFVTPLGVSVVTGVDAGGIALTPDGRYAIVGDDDRGSGAIRSAIDPDATDGPSLAVVETATLTVASRFRPPPGESYAGGVVAVRDPAAPGQTLVLAAGGTSNAVFAFELDAYGRLTPDARHRIAIAGPTDPAFADLGQSAPTSLVAAPDGRHAYVVEAAGGSVAAIDLATRRVLGPPHAVGFFPSCAAVAGTRLIVSNEGMMRYARVARPVSVPPFGTPPAALPNASSLSLVDLTVGGGLVPPELAGDGPFDVPMDQPADGLRIVGGAHPTALAVTPDGRDAYVAMTNVDRIATVALEGTPHVAGGTELRLFDRGPYGTQPVALALSRDASRLYVALRGLDAIAVIDARDPLHLHRLGLIPTGWDPTALALSADDRTLFVVNQKGFGDDGGAVWSTLQRIDLAGVKLAVSTRATLAATRKVLVSAAHGPKAVKDVVVIVADHESYDAVFGDLPGGSAALVRAGAARTPNLHALADRFALAANFYADAANPQLAQQVIAGGQTTAFGETTATLAAPLFAGADDPEAAPRIGTIFQALARRNIAFRDYGAFLSVAGFDGTSYAYDVPAAEALASHVDLDYPGPDPALADTRRADAFIRDYDAQIAAAALPRFAYVSLPGAQPAVTDAAIGAIVDHLSHLPTWRSTAVIVASGDTGGAADHVDAARSFALVISPYAKRRFVGMQHLSTASILKTLDGVFGLPPISLGDLLTSDMSAFFTATADPRPYVEVPAASL